jgi:circadian clock protein KaiB
MKSKTRTPVVIKPALKPRKPAPNGKKYVMRLFVAGATTRSLQAVLRIRQLCEAQMQENFVLEVIDIYQQPELARANQIIATPTLIKERPKPVRRFIGSLMNISGLFPDGDLIPPLKAGG